MKLPLVPRDLQRDLREFDIWITPSLGEITDTEKFAEELRRVAYIFDEMATATNNFAYAGTFPASSIASTFAALARTQARVQRIETLQALAAVLFLVTGKSDNNAKCQFPIFLRDVARWEALPALKRGRIVAEPIPRALKSDDYMERVGSLDDPAQEQRLLEKFVSFVLSTDDAVRQLWSLGWSYCRLRELAGGGGYEQRLLAPIVIFKIRGSVTASGGHRPEAFLRELLAEWGLSTGPDFNVTDVVVDGEDTADEDKRRAYDFVLPYLTNGWAEPWARRLMVQSQFYAGDSGSVSHKNVDQTGTSRTRVLLRTPDARFIEYVDGAGYFSSLNSDLRKLLGMETTRSFFQLRSAPIRLRRELQQLGFLLPIEVEQMILRTDGVVETVRAALIGDGYLEDEVERCMRSVHATGLVSLTQDVLSVRPERRDVVRRYFLMDAVAVHGHAMAQGDRNRAVLIPGYGDFYGCQLEALLPAILPDAGQLQADLQNAQSLLSDLGQLASRGFVMFGA